MKRLGLFLIRVGLRLSASGCETVLDDLGRDAPLKHKWVPYHSNHLSVTPEDKEWADKHQVFRCEVCSVWIWACKPKDVE